MGRIQVFLLILIGIVIITVLNSAFIVNQREQALVLQLGAPVEVINEVGSDEAGLHFKIPFVQQVEYFDKRNLFLDLESQTITAGDIPDDAEGADVFGLAGSQGSNVRLTVDAFARWRITDPLQFFQRVNNEERGRQRIESILQTATREVLGTVPSTEIISGQRAELMSRIRDRVAERVQETQLGVEIIDVRIKRVELPEENRNQVFARMVSERRQEATRIRAEGREEAARIEADARRQVRVIEAEANEQDQRLRGEGDGERQAIYGRAFGRDPEFFEFYRSLQAYERSIGDNTPLILSPDSEFFRYFGNQSGQE